jgi:LuxR family maltose regulon positive regulatory protein
MPGSAIPRVSWDTHRRCYQISTPAGPGIAVPATDVESETWAAWLNQVPSFAFQSQDGYSLTARKERRTRGDSYWIAYRKVGGKLVKMYIGRPADVSLARLEQVAAALAQPERHTASAANFPQQVDDRLLATKFFVPTAAHPLIARPHPLALLDAGVTRPLTLISAPAGFGKTTLLASWLAEKAKGKRQKATDTD